MAIKLLYVCVTNSKYLCWIMAAGGDWYGRARARVENSKRRRRSQIWRDLRVCVCLVTGYKSNLSQCLGSVIISTHIK